MHENRIRCKPGEDEDASKMTLLYKARKRFALLRVLNESKEHSNLYHSVLLNVERGHQSRSSIASRQCDQSPVGGRKEEIKKSSTQVDEGTGGQSTNPGPNLPRCVILHYSPFKAIWDWITLILVLYIALATPYFAAFHSITSSSSIQDFSRKNSDSFEYSINGSQQSNAPLTIDTRPSKFSKRGSINILVIVDLIVDIMFLADILINFRTTYLHDGEVVTEPGKIAINYIKGWFFIDALAAIPFDLLLFRVPTDRVTLTGVLKAARLLRLLRVARRIDQYSEYGAAVLILLMGTFVLISHWLACIFYAIAYYERLMPDALPIGWLDGLANKTGRPYMANDSQSGPDTGTSYITSLYFTFTILTSVGFGNVAAVTNSEKVFTIIAMLVGSLLSAAIFGNVSSIMLRLYQGTEEYLEMQTRIKEFIRFHQIPKLLADRLIESFQHSRSFAHGIDMNSVLKGFPECLQADICLHLNRVLLSNCEAFSGASQGCLRALSVKFKSTHCPPGDTLVHPGDIIDAMYFIARGTIEVVADDIIMAILGKGDIIGDDSIFSSDLPSYPESKAPLVVKSSYSVRAISYCDLHTITVAELKSILAAYPEFAGKFVKNFRVTFNLKKDDLLFRSTTLEKSMNKLLGQEKQTKKKQSQLTAQERIANMRRAFSTKGRSSVMEPLAREIPEEEAGSRGSIVILSPYGASTQPTDEDFKPFHASASLNCTSSTKTRNSNKKTHSASDIASWNTTSCISRPQNNRISLETEPPSLTVLYANGNVRHTLSISTPQSAVLPLVSSILTPCIAQSMNTNQQGFIDLMKEGISARRQSNQYANINSGSKSFDDQLSTRIPGTSTFLNIEESTKGKSASCGEPQTFFDLHSVHPQTTKDASITVHHSPSSTHFSNFYSNDIPQPLRNINDRLREINRRMWAFEKNLFTAVDKILEMLNAQPHLFSTIPHPANQHSPPVDLSP